jgi:hypothetical protein
LLASCCSLLIAEASLERAVGSWFLTLGTGWQSQVGCGHRAWGALLVPGSSCGMAAGPLFVARCQWPRAGRPCLLAPRALLHCRLWSRRVRTVPCPGQLWSPAYRVSWPATLSLRAVACRPWSMTWPSLRGQRVAARPPFPCPDRLPCLRRCLYGRVVWLVR